MLKPSLPLNAPIVTHESFTIPKSFSKNFILIQPIFGDEKKNPNLFSQNKKQN